jgi:hypothetical protein
MASEPKTERARDPMIVELTVGRESADDVLGAIDAALAAGTDVSVTVSIPAGHPARAAVAELCEGDPRVSIGANSSSTGGFQVRMPATARPAETSLDRIRALLAADGVGELDIVVPGRSLLAERLRMAGLPGGPRMVVTGPGKGRRRVRGPAVGVGSSRFRRQLEGRSKGALAEERAEHLRHRARSATYRAQFDRQTQRLARERMQVRHERARLQLAQRRVAAASPVRWLVWRVSQLRAVLFAVPRLVMTATRTIRAQLRRVRRLIVTRGRERAVAQGPRPGEGPDSHYTSARRAD